LLKVIDFEAQSIHMSIAKYIKQIGRGKDGARSIDRSQAKDLLGQILDGQTSDLEIGAFCLAMRIKGETPIEMAGFLDAIQDRLKTIENNIPAVVIPSYNGARKLPVLTPLLAFLIARQGLPVIVHGTSTESNRVNSQEILFHMGAPLRDPRMPAVAGEVQFVPTMQLSNGLQMLLQVRQAVGLRNSAHSLVKLMNPCSGEALLVTSYTHPEYAISMRDTLTLIKSTALLLRGTEGEPVADPRRIPAMDTLQLGELNRIQDPETRSLQKIPNLPSHEASETAAWTNAVLAQEVPVPVSIALQVKHIANLYGKM